MITKPSERMWMMREIELLVIHCAATPNGRPHTVQDIDSWHRANGWQRKSKDMQTFNPRLSAIGYHYVIYVDGTVHTGRRPEEIGAHVAGHNSNSLGICLVGTDKFTPRQWAALSNLVHDLRIEYSGAKICGHRDLPGVHKSCPGFSVADWMKDGLPLPEHTLSVAE
jgi:N-acetyl-anhydromuramyl-L-alanine amidase AmpD